MLMQMRQAAARAWRWRPLALIPFGVLIHDNLCTFKVVPDDSMAPALPKGSLAFVWRCYGFFPFYPRRGDIVCVFKPEGDGSLFRRMVAVPPDLVEARTDTGAGDKLELPPGFVWLEPDNVPVDAPPPLEGIFPKALVHSTVMASFPGGVARAKQCERVNRVHSEQR